MTPSPRKTPTPAETRLATIMAENEVTSLTALSAQIGVGFESCKKWGPRNSISKAGATAIAARYGYRLEWVLTGEEPKRPSGMSDAGNSFHHPEGEAGERRRRERLEFLARVSEAPELFVQLLSGYRDIYSAEGVPISDLELIATTLQDYAELVVDPMPPEERSALARGMIVKQRQWIRDNRRHMV